MNAENPAGLMEQETTKLNGSAPTLPNFNTEDFAVTDDNFDDDDFAFEDESEGETPENSHENSEKEGSEKTRKKREAGSGKRDSSQEDDGLIRKQALGAVNVFSIGLKYICAAYASENPDEFAVSKRDKEELTDAFEAYIAVKGEVMTPEQALAASLLSVAGYYGFKAHSIRMDKKKNKGIARQLVKDGSMEIKNGEVVTGTKLTEAPKIYTGRRQFKIFKSTGCYCKTEKGQDLTREEAKEKAPDWIIQMWERAKSEDWSEAETNKRILEIINSGKEVAGNV